MEEVGDAAVSRSIRQPTRMTHDAFGVGLFDSNSPARLCTLFGPAADFNRATALIAWNCVSSVQRKEKSTSPLLRPPTGDRGGIPKRYEE